MVNEQKVLDKGFVKLLNVYGDKYTILRSARISTGGQEKKTDLQDKGLLRYLYKNEHMSPFEQVTLQFEMKAPHSIIKQLLRHRTFKFNEYSLRYSEAIDDMYMPDEWRKQGEKNHQGSGESCSYEVQKLATEKTKEVYDLILKNYKDLISMGVSREQARFLLPLANYSLITFTVDLRNLFHFLDLRMHEHAQEEIRVYANAMYEMLLEEESLDWVMEIFREYQLIEYSLKECLNKYSVEDFQNILHSLARD